MSRGKYTPEFKAKIVLEVLQGERELGAIAAENNLNPNMVRNWKAEFVENASSIFEEHGKADREVKRKEAAAAKERDKMRRLRASLLRGWKNIFSRCWQMRKRLMGADWRSCCLRGARRRT